MQKRPFTSWADRLMQVLRQTQFNNLSSNDSSAARVERGIQTLQHDELAA